jgi:hypothetical protein
MTHLGNYIREEMNKISPTFDLFNTTNDKCIDDYKWTKQVKKGAAKNMEPRTKGEMIISSNNSFEVRSEEAEVNAMGK